MAQIQEYLDKQFSWRLKEISDLKLSIKIIPQIKKHTLMRAGIALLYAHWEGFVKCSAEAYINYIAHQRIRYRALKPCFIALGLKKYLEKLTKSEDPGLYISALQFLLTELEEKSKLSYVNSIDTHSNLNSNIFERIAKSIGIDTITYETKYNFIDKELLRRRNFIAHGDYLNIDIDSYSEISDTVIILMRSFKNDLENSLVLKKYLISKKSNYS